jgi:hypothetical protein
MDMSFKNQTMLKTSQRLIELTCSPSSIGFIIALMAISQKFLYPYIILILACYHFNSSDKNNQTINGGEIFKIYGCVIIGACFCILASRNAFSDLATGLLDSKGALISSLTRSCLYIAVPILLIGIIRDGGNNSVSNLIRGIITGIHTKIITCWALTEQITGLPVRKGFIIDFPTLKPDVSNWVGTNCIVASALIWILYSSYQHQKLERKHFELGIALNLVLCISYTALFDNLSCSISALISIGLIVKLVFNLGGARQISLGSLDLLAKQKWLRFGVFTSSISLITVAWAKHQEIVHLAEKLRLQHLFLRNDRIEFLLQGFKRLATHQPSVSYLFKGPLSFQKPICFGTAETFLANTAACHNYWHILPWDSFRNAGYIGLLVSLIMLLVLCKELLGSASSRNTAIAIGFSCVLYLCFSRPIVEAGSGEILPLLMLTTVCFLENHKKEELLSIC